MMIEVDGFTELRQMLSLRCSRSGFRNRNQAVKARDLHLLLDRSQAAPCFKGMKLKRYALVS